MNRQNSFNQMLRGPVHAGSSLPSEQFAAQGTDPRMSDFRMFQGMQAQANGQGAGSLASRQQMAFAAANSLQAQTSGGGTTYPPGWPAAVNGSETGANGGLQNALNQPSTTMNGMPPRLPANGVGVNGMMNLNGRALSQLPPGANLLFRNSAESVQPNGKVSLSQTSFGRLPPF